MEKSGKWRAAVPLIALWVLIMTALIPSEKIKKAIWYPVIGAVVVVICFATLRSVLSQLKNAMPEGDCVVDSRAMSPIWLYLGAVVITLSAIGLVLNPVINFPVAFSVAGLLVGTVCVFCSSFRLRIVGQRIEYWSMENGYQSLLNSQIKMARIRIGLSSRPGIRLEIMPASNEQKPIFVALKAFRKRDMNRVWDWLGPKLEDTHGLKVVNSEQ